MTFILNSKPVSVVVATSLLLLVSTITVSHPVPQTDCSSANETTDPAASGHVEQVFGGMEILIKLGSHLNGTILGFPDIQSVSAISIFTNNMLSVLDNFIEPHGCQAVFSVIILSKQNHCSYVWAFQCGSGDWWSMSNYQAISSHGTLLVHTCCLWSDKCISYYHGTLSACLITVLIWSSSMVYQHALQHMQSDIDSVVSRIIYRGSTV